MTRRAASRVYGALRGAGETPAPPLQCRYKDTIDIIKKRARYASPYNFHSISVTVSSAPVSYTIAPASVSSCIYGRPLLSRSTVPV